MVVFFPLLRRSIIFFLASGEALRCAGTCASLQKHNNTRVPYSTLLALRPAFWAEFGGELK